MSAREKLEGLQFDDTLVIDYVGQKKYKTKCIKCNKEKIMYGSNIKKHSGTKCDIDKIPLDLTGQQIGDWKVIKYVGNKKYLCECQCEKHTIKEVLKVNLMNGSSTSCGHNRNSYGDLTGKQFGEWAVIRKKGYQWECRCSCAKSDDETHLIYAKDLVSGRTKSCGHSYNKFENISGNTYGLWHVLEYVGNQYYKCQCSCKDKTIRLVKKASLINGKATSCGCDKRNKTQKTLLERYGEIGPNKINNPRSKEQIEAISSKKKLKQFIEEQFIDVFGYKPKTTELSRLLGIGLARVLTIIHNFELEDEVDLTIFSSVAENDILNYIKTLYNGEIKIRDKTVLQGRELDIYIPEKKLAIEFNGMYWHSDIYKPKLYHQQKTIDCAKKGIRLIHIFEYEWEDIVKQEKIIKLLNNVLTDNPQNKLYARKLEIKEISNNEAYEFEEKYHLQGKANSSINIALLHDNKIVGLMTFNKPRFNNNYEYELIRLCWKTDVYIVGGTERLFSYFVKTYNPQSIITYTDISKFTGNVYTRLGFKPIEPNPITEPNYVWVDGNTNEILTRYQTQKHKLIERGLGTEDQTEDEIMKDLNYLKVYDCGNIKLEWKGRE